MSRFYEEADRQYKKQQKKGQNTSKIFLDPRDEEEALNIFAEDGYFVKKASYWDLVSFRTGEGMFVHYRVDFRWFRSKDDFTRYLAERTLAGWSHIWGTQKSGRQYWMCDADYEGNITGKKEDELFPRKAILAGRKKRFLSQILVLTAILILWIVFLFLIFGVTWRAFWFWTDRYLLEFPILIIKLGPFLALLGFWVYYIIQYVRLGRIIREEG